MRIQSSIIRDTLELENHKGEIVKTIPFSVNIVEVGDNIMKKRIELSKADAEGSGKAFVDILRLVFGDETTNELIEFYGNDYTALVADTTPVLVDFVFPAVDKQREKLVELRKRVKH